MLGLRLREGISLNSIIDRFGEEIGRRILQCLKVFITDNLVNFDREHQRLSLNVPRRVFIFQSCFNSSFLQS